MKENQEKGVSPVLAVSVRDRVGGERVKDSARVLSVEDSSGNTRKIYFASRNQQRS